MSSVVAEEQLTISLPAAGRRIREGLPRLAYAAAALLAVASWLGIVTIERSRVAEMTERLTDAVNRGADATAEKARQTLTGMAALAALAEAAQTAAASGNAAQEAVLRSQIQRILLNGPGSIIRLGIVSLSGQPIWRDPDDGKAYAEPAAATLAALRAAAPDSTAFAPLEARVAEGRRVAVLARRTIPVPGAQAGIVSVMFDADLLMPMMMRSGQFGRIEVQLRRPDGSTLLTSAVDATGDGDAVPGQPQIVAERTLASPKLAIRVAAARPTLDERLRRDAPMVLASGLTGTGLLFLVAWLGVASAARSSVIGEAHAGRFASVQNERRIRGLLEGVSDCVTVRSPRDRLIFCSSASSEVLGYPPEIVMQDGHLPMIAAARASEFVPGRPLRQDSFGAEPAITGSGIVVMGPFRFSHPRKGDIWLESRICIVDLPGEGPCTVTSTRDVTGYVQAQSRLHELNSEIRFLLEASPGVIYRVTGSGVAAPAGALLLTVTYVSPNARRVLGADADALRSYAGWRAMIHPDDSAGVQTALARAVATGQASVSYRVRGEPAKTGAPAWRWLQDQMRLVTRAPDGAFELVGYVSDVTGTRELEEKLSHVSKLALLGEMATAMAHELNQPLAVIGIAAENLLEGIDFGYFTPEEGTMRLNRIADQVERASGIIDHMRAFGRISGRALGPVRLSAAISEAMTLVGPQLRAEAIRTEIELPDDLAAVRATHLQLEQVLMNLLLNARDAYRLNPDAPAQDRRIAIRARAADGAISLVVHDNAGGIPPDVLPRIFDPFFTTKPAGVGTGLGLSVSYGIIIEFGGQMVATNADRGACFEITLQPWEMVEQS